MDLLKDLKNKNRYLANFTKDLKLIYAVTAATVVWSVIYIVLFYHPVYKSEAKVWVKDVSTREYVTSLGGSNNLAPLISSGNPILTQIEILKSDQLRKTVERYEKDFGTKAQGTKFSIDVKNKPNTDILNIAVGANTPERAQNTLAAVLQEYDNINLGINNQISKSRREYIELNLMEINEKLFEVRRQIKEYKTENLAIDVATEANKLVEQGVFMSSRLETKLAEIQEAQYTVRELEKQLGLKPKAALDAVALGSGNKVLELLRVDLNKAIQEYEFDSEKLADTNPKMVAQKARIDEINRQIKNQIETSIGKQTRSNINIYDPVRESIARRLVETQARYVGLQAEERVIRQSINNINSTQSKLPEKKFTLDNLEQEEKALSKAYDNLKDKQIEASIREAETVSNIIIVDRPSLPQKSSFPSRVQVLIMSLFFGGLIGLVASVLKTLMDDVCEDVEYVEKVTGAPVIGAIPCVSKQLPTEDIQFIHGMALDSITSNILMKCSKNNQKIITFTSSSFKKRKRTVMCKIGTRLKRVGHSVCIVDGNFRIPNIIKEMGLENELMINLSDFILTLENKLKSGVATNVKNEIEIALTTGKGGINYLGNKDIVFEPCEFFGTAAFELILKTLSEMFDWVLIDTGAAHITPEFTIISKLSDGVVLFADRYVTCTTIKDIARVVKNSSLPLVGTIMREPNSKLEKEYEKYLYLQERKLTEEVEMEPKNVKQG
ncbi:lipopolysaccharide biosynthesis protein [Candidatus Gastranaerophilus sp. (ex Termes propinquus)]|nr:lipopolysaccharide biosynthesis protein [Candidatus Gastranaerophilus sp. (ex Termes propinquus)]